ncbi:hypothetical protein NUU61_006634 [Penicillium alfredii]|uniref:Serine hydrolase domain-containing protein n=1 Tax=Penicillium alfredii TaxID=1506179 RepID=A0A9W9F1C9_9EURO|nr:uncharacterized protein NUU61_006634 [Penicillium alfredii]KAJ5091764.1 hypothetical protein NUU61_006634 [Penicillium alfredii]
MKFLCLPGGYCSAKCNEAFAGFDLTGAPAVGPGPFCDSLTSNGEARFFFTQGTTPVYPPPEYEGFFGPPPNFTFAEPDGPSKFNMRDFPKRDTPEATMKDALELAGQPTFSNIRLVVDRLIGILDSDEDIAGVIGYSEGAEMAASLILEEQRRHKESGREPRLKCAVLMCGWPPMDPVTGQVVLADEHFGEEIINIPTCHVIGAADPFLDASMALYNLCDPDSAELFDHGGGHVIPRTKKTVDDLTGVVRDMILSVG